MKSTDLDSMPQAVNACHTSKKLKKAGKRV
jgi:hypothetical protein